MSFPRLAAVVALGAIAAACSSKSSSSQDPGLTPGGGGDITGHDANPDGVAYPSDHLGFKARGSTVSTAPRGDRIENFKFLGYPDGDISKGLQPFALADFYDPTGKNTKIIHISVAGVWCTWCIAETKALAGDATHPSLIPQLKDKKVVYLTALSEDIHHEPAAQKDLDFWINTYKPGYTQLLDPGNRNLGPFFTSAGIPWNGNFDARSMEILSSITSAPTSDGSTIDIMGDVQPWLDWYDAGPSAYAQN
jgi:hypothetical protein